MQRPNIERMVEVLMVEDNPADVRLAMEAWREMGVSHHLSVARNGDEALAFLRREPPHGRAPRPDLMILDLNLPRKDGRELLTELKVDPVLRRIPVIVLTTSNRDHDIARSYDLQASCYIVKPVGLDPALRVMRTIAEFWFTVASLPSAPR